MRQEMKYKTRRVIAALILVGIFLAFTVSVLVKGIDADFQRQDAVMQEHFRIHGVER